MGRDYGGYASTTDTDSLRRLGISRHAGPGHRRAAAPGAAAVAGGARAVRPSPPVRRTAAGHHDPAARAPHAAGPAVTGRRRRPGAVSADGAGIAVVAAAVEPAGAAVPGAQLQPQLRGWRAGRDRARGGR